MKKFLTILFIAMATRGLAQKDVQKFRIDPSLAYGGAVSDFFDSVEYIPLETNKESLFGYISDLIITDSSFVIFDYDTKSILFFSLTGSFIKKISKTNGQIPNAVFYDKSLKKILIISVNGSGALKSTEYYNVDGTYFKTVSLDKEARNKLIYSIYLGDNLYASYNRPYDLENAFAHTDSQFYFFTINKGPAASNLLPYDKAKNKALLKLISTMPRFFSPPLQNSSFYFSTPLEHQVYRVSKDSAVKFFQFVFPASLGVNPQLFKIDNEEKIDSIIKQDTWSKNNTILSVSNIVIEGDLIYFKTNTRAFGYYGPDAGVVNRNFIYNIKSGKLIALERITEDSSTYYLPFMEPYVVRFKGVNYGDGYFYAHISSLKMFQSMDATKFKNPQYPASLKSYFTTQDRKSNPVIVKMKLKD
jgi:hypothetical protein